MLNHINKLRGQSTLEYAVLIVIIIGALLTIQVYIKRGVQGRLKSASDDIGDQYSPGNTNAIKITHTKSTTKELFGQDEEGNQRIGVSESKIDGHELTNTTERSQILNTQREYWGTKAEAK